MAPHSDSIPDASDLVIAARGLPEPTPSGGATAGRSRHGGRSGSDVALDPHDYDRDRESGLTVEECLRRQPRQSVGFWDPRLNQVRRKVTMEWAAMVLVLNCVIMAVLALYWADLFVVDEKLRALTVHVVDFDGQGAAAPPQEEDSTPPPPLVGPTMVEVAREMMAEGAAPSLGYAVVPPAAYGHDPAAARRAVYDWDCYAAVVVGPDATAALRAAARAGDPDYDPAAAAAVQFVLLSARQESTYSDYVVPQLVRLERAFAARFGPRWARALMSADGDGGNGTAYYYPREALARAPATVNPGVVPVWVDLRPFRPAVATPAVTVGLIYLIIMAFFSFSFFLPIHMKYIQTEGHHPPLRFRQLVAWRLCATVGAYLFISLAYSLVSLAFQIPFWPGPGPETDAAPSATAYGRGSFPVYWMVNFVGMNALGIACENVAMIVGTPWTALWLIFWVITNVATSFYTIELAPGFFRWGYAWPLFHVVQASRQILFDLHSRIGLDFGVLFAWSAVNVALFPFCCYFMRWKTERGQRRAERDKDTFAVKTGTDEQVKFRKERGTDPPKRKRGFMRGM